METDNKRIVKNGFFSIIQICVTTLSYLVIYWIIVQRLGKEQLAIWTTIAMIPATISVLGSGVSGCLLRYVPVYQSNSNSKQFNKVIFNGIIFNILVSLIIVCPGYFFAKPLLEFLFNAKNLPDLYYQVYYASLLTFFINFTGSVFLFGLDGLQLTYKRNIILIISSTALCLLGVWFISLWGLIGILYAQIIQAGTVFCISLLQLKKTPLFSFSEMSFSREHFKLFSTYGQKLQYISFSIMLFEPLTRWFLLYYFNLYVVGIYEIVNRIVTQIRGLLVSAIQVIAPIVSKQQEENNLDVNDLYFKAFKGAALLSVLAYGSLICIALSAFLILKVQDVHIYLWSLVFLSAASLVNILSAPAYSILTGLGKLKTIIISHIFSTVLNLFLFFLLSFHPATSLLALPPAIAILVSSGYVIYSFRLEYGYDNFSLQKQDSLICAISVISSLISLILFEHFRSIFIQSCFSLVYSLVIIYLMFTNPFLLMVKNRLLLRQKEKA